MEVTPIGYVKTPFPEKFGVPRQSGMIPAIGHIVLSCEPGALDDLETFTHVWILFLFDRRGTGCPTHIGTPRGGVKRGVLATRSPHHPNGIGMSVCRLINVNKTTRIVTVSGVDMLNDTPVLDIKPYLAYVDSVPSAGMGWIGQEEVPTYRVSYADGALPEEMDNDTRHLIHEMLRLDPRPPSQTKSWPISTTSGRIFSFKVGVDPTWLVRWEVRDGGIYVLSAISYISIKN